MQTQTKNEQQFVQREKTREELQESLARVRKKARNQKTTLKQLNRAMIVRLYENNNLEAENARLKSSLNRKEAEAEFTYRQLNNVVEQNSKLREELKKLQKED